MPNDLLPTVVEAIKFFENVKPGVEGIIASGGALLSAGKASIYVIQKGAKLISYLITRPNNKEKASTDKDKKSTRKSKQKSSEPEFSKDNVVILVDINRRMVVDVTKYLDMHKIDADLVIITNDSTYGSAIKPLDVNKPEEWESIVRDFMGATDKIKRMAGGRNIHIFLSTTLTLAFALGSVWGTIDEATIYHWEGMTYFPVMKISRSLRFQ
jgi:hypothetical protein